MQIPLSKGLFAEVDEVDYALVSQWKWSAHVLSHTTYARRMMRLDGKRVNQYMHRLILPPPDGMDVDHIDHDGLNNRRANLRSLSRTENLWNLKTGPDGVFWHPQTKKWRARIKHLGKRLFLGGYTDRDAAKAARAYASAVLRREPVIPPFDALALPPLARQAIQASHPYNLMEV